MVGPARIFKYTSVVRAMLPDLQRYRLNLIKNVEIVVVFLSRKVFISLSFSVASLSQRTRKKILISNSYLIRQRFQGYRFKLGNIAFFAWRVT